MSKLVVNNQMPIMIAEESELWKNSYTSYGSLASTNSMNSPITLIKSNSNIIYFNPVHMPYNNISVPYIPNIKDSNSICFSTSKSNDRARDYNIYSGYNYSSYNISSEDKINKDSNRKAFYYKIGASTGNYEDNSGFKYYKAGDHKPIIGVQPGNLGII